MAAFGHSLGGLVALSLAARSPRRVRCTILVSGGGAPLSPVRLLGIEAACLLFRLLLKVPGATLALGRTPLGHGVLRLAVHDWRSLPAELLREMVPRSATDGFMDGVRLGRDGLKGLDLAAVAPPVLVVWGRQDRILPLAVARQFEARLKHARLVVLDRVGHCAMFEAPGRFNRLALSFLRRQLVAVPSRR